MLAKSEVCDDIKSIDFGRVFLNQIINNGERVVVLQDKLSLLDRFAKTFFSKNDTNFVQSVLKVFTKGFKL